MIVDNSHVFLQFSELGVHVQSEANQELEIISWDKIKKKELALWSKLKIERHLVKVLTIEILHSDFLLIPQEYDTHFLSYISGKILISNDSYRFSLKCLFYIPLHFF